MRVQRHVPSPLIPRPGPFTTTWSRHVNKDTWCFWVQSKPSSTHFLSSLAFYLLSTESQWNFPLRDPWISKTLTFPAHKKWCGDGDVCVSLSCLTVLLLQLAYLLGYCNDKTQSKYVTQYMTLVNSSAIIFFSHRHQDNNIYGEAEMLYVFMKHWLSVPERKVNMLK